MKIFLRRIAAFFIDSLVLGLIYELLGIKNLPKWVMFLSFNIGVVPVGLPSFGFFIFLMVLAVRNIVFRNASIGKIIMGLRIVDENWNVPPVKVIIKREIEVVYLGPLFFLYYDRKFTVDNFVDYEMNRVKTKVVSTKQLRKHREEECSRS